MRIGSTESISGQVPTNTTYWEVQTSFKSIATGFLFAEDAVINRNLQVGSATYACGRIVVNSDGEGIVVRSGGTIDVEDGGSINLEEGSDIKMIGKSGSPSLHIFANTAGKAVFYRYLDDGQTPPLLYDHPTSTFASD